MAARETIIAAPALLRDGRLTGPGAVAIAEGRITRVLDAPDGADIALPDITLPWGVLAPGLIDLHNNGAFGVDFAKAEGEDWPCRLSRDRRRRRLGCTGSGACTGRTPARRPADGADRSDQ